MAKTRKRKPCDICGKSHISKSRRRCVREQLDLEIDRLVQERDGNICQWCGNLCYGRNHHVSHVVRRSNSTALRWDMANVKTLCQGCHHTWHQDEFTAIAWFQGKFPLRHEYLLQKLTEYRSNPPLCGMQWCLDKLEELRNGLSGRSG